MSAATAAALFEERNRAVGELRELGDAAENREFTGEETAKAENLNTAITDLDERIRYQLRMSSLDESASELAGDLAKMPVAEVRDNEPQVDADTAAWQSMISGETRAHDFPMVEHRTLLQGTATDGAELVPTSTANEVVAAMREGAASIATIARTLNTASGADIVVPTVTTFGAAAAVAEAGTIGGTDPQFGTVTLGAWKFAQLIKVSAELGSDEVVGLRAFLSEVAGENLARAVGLQFISGDGTTEPQGVTATTNAKNVVAAAQAAVTGDELIKLYHAVASGYRMNGTWVMNDATVEAIRKLKSTDNQYLWQPGLQAGVPDTLLGRPIATDDNVDTLAATKIVALFGDFRRGYIVRQAGGVRVESSTDFAFDEDLVAYRFIVRVDGKIVDHKAIAKLTTAT